MSHSESADVRYDPCPMGCGRPTEDPYGGPCKFCWDAAPRFDAAGCQMCGAHEGDPCDCFDPQGAA